MPAACVAGDEGFVLVAGVNVSRCVSAQVNFVHVLGSLLAVLLLLTAPVFAVEGPLWIQGNQVNLRSKPGGDVQTRLDVNEKVFVVERRDGWAYVSAPRLELKGWVAEQYVGKQKVSLDASGNPVTRVAPPPKANAPAAARRSDPELSADDFGTELGGDLTTQIIINSSLSSTAPPVASSQLPPESGALSQTTQHSSQGVISRQPSSSEASATDELSELRVLANLPAALTAGQPLADRSAAGFVPDAPETTLQSGGGTAFAFAIPADIATPSPSVETGAHNLQWNGNATTVVTSPMMLEGSFFAVGGRDMGKINGTDVNLREGPDTKARSLGKLQPGDKLFLTTFKSDWFEVSVPARQLKGWVHSKYVHEFPKVEITGTQVRLRSEPNTESEIKTTLDKGEVFYEYERKNGWVKVASSASGINGWVRGDYVALTDRNASLPYSVKGDMVNFRASPEVDADIIARLPKGKVANVFGRNEKWSYIEVQGRYGWMYSEYLVPGGAGSNPMPGGSSRPVRGFIVPSSPVGERLIARAKAMSGTPYVWGGESDGGVDCSGLIYKVLLDEGASGKCLPRRASEQMAQLGLEVDKENLQPGDLVFFTTYKAGPSHVGIYLGDGDFIHASSARSQVTINSMSDGYYKQRFVGARRITEDELRSLK
jgi:cell wall-associated NlpC family hydrolase